MATSTTSQNFHPMPEVTTVSVRRLEFCAGHRVYQHESKCRNAHGHQYTADIEASGGLDHLGRVVDFSVLKGRVGGWIDQNWDHGFLVYAGDREMLDALHVIQGQKIFIMPANPTAENIAAYLLTQVCPGLLMGTGATVTRVTIHQNLTCRASVSL